MESKKVSRRELLRYSAMATAAVIAIGCAPTGTKPAEPTQAAGGAATSLPETTAVPAKQPVELTFWIAWGANAAEVLAGLGEADEFKEQNPNVTVTVVPSKDMQSLLTAIASGEGPDGASNLPYSELYARGAVLPVTDWVNESTVVKKDDIFEAAWRGATYKGQIWGVPAIEGFVRYGLCYNVEMFEQADLDPSKPPTTWSELFDMHKKLTMFDEAGNVKQIGFDPYDAMGGSFGYGDPWIIPYSWGFKYYDPDNARFNIDNPDMVDAWKVLTGFYDHIGAEKMAGFRQSYGTWTDPTASFIVGTQAIQINGYWTPGELFHVKPDLKVAYSWMPVPDKRRGKRVQVAGGHYIVIPAVAKHPEEMYRYAEFCNTDTGAGMIYDGLGWLASSKSFLQKVDVSKYPGLDWFVKSAMENDEFGEIPVNPVEGFCADTWNQLREKVYFHQMTAEEGVAQMQADCEKALADMLKSG